MNEVNRLKLPLNSDQLELLLAFENTKGLGHLAEVMARDQSVVSRNLQRIAEDYPVLKKVKRTLGDHSTWYSNQSKDPSLS
ncbi:MAG: hypothetical protein IPK04_15535 [Bdellovibrionales bacterium]|nr:hypothetical protein [Bdellovibrionales bacterium]